MDLFFSLLFRINQDIRDRNLLKSRDRILLTISGGQDSICLILFFAALRDYWMWELAIIHCDHGWRKDSKSNAYHVFRLAEKYNIPYFQVLPTKNFANEEKARTWRYLVITDIACQYNYQNIVTGHTATDRAETMFLNLNRGSSRSGINSLQWKRLTRNKQYKKLYIIRPLLAIQREELKSIVRHLNIPIWPDITNQQTKLTRNKIRKQIFPYLRFILNKNIDKSFAQFTELIHVENIFFEKLTKKIFTNLYTDYSVLDLINFQLIPISLQRRVLKYFIEEKTEKIPEYEDIEKIRYLCLNPKSIKSIFLKNNEILFIENNKLFFKKI